MNPVSQPRTGLAEPLCGPLSSRFAARPTLHDVAGRIIDEQWRSRAIDGPPPSSLTLHRLQPAGDFRLKPCPLSAPIRLQASACKYKLRLPL